MTREDSADSLRYVELHIELCAKRLDDWRGENTLSHMSQRGNALPEPQPARQGHADSPIAGEIARAGEHQVTQRRWPDKRLGLSPHGCPKPCGLSKAPRDEGGAGVGPQRELIGHTRGNGQDIFNCPAELNPHKVIGGIDPHAAAMKGPRGLPCPVHVMARQTQHHRKPLSNLLGKARATEGPHGPGGERPPNQVRWPRKGAVCPLGDPLGEQQETSPLRRLWQLLRNRPRQGLKARHRRGQNEESTRLPTCCLVPPNQGGLEIAGHLKAWGKAVSWQITGIFPR